MSRLTAVVAVVLGLTVVDPRVLAQPRPIIAVLDAAGQPCVMFGPRNQPVANPEAAISPVSMPVSKPDARMPDGMIVSAIAFDGWIEGSLFRVVALTVVHKDGEPAPDPGCIRDLPKRQIASFTLAIGQSHSVEEMNPDFRFGCGTFAHPSVEQKQRVVADRLEVPVVGAAFLLPMPGGRRILTRARSGGIGCDRSRVAKSEIPRGVEHGNGRRRDLYERPRRDRPA
jgi:hypothetical protein